MIKFMTTIVGLVCLLMLGCGESASTSTATTAPSKEYLNMSGPLSITVKSLAGEDVNLASYQGNVVMIVNTASKCGLTPQYEKLQALHEKYHAQGLRILGFPANNFAGQEPGSNEQIAAFCQTNYGVAFDMFAKVSVKGDDQTPLYAYLTSEQTNGQFAGDITWNFEKFLIDKSGNVIARFDPKVTPDDPQVVEAIEAALAQGS